MSRNLKLTPVVDPNLVLKAFSAMQGGAASFVGAIGGLPGKGKSAFGGLAAAMSASGLPGQFGQLQSLISGVSSGLDSMGNRGKTSFGKILTGVGIGAAAMGGAGLLASKPLQDANAALKQSVEDSGHSMDEVAAPLAKTKQHLQDLGFSYADTTEAAAKLTQGLGDPQKALEREGLAADWARRNHVSLATAADLVNKAYAKSPMALRALGINLTDMTKAGKDAETAQKNQAKAADELTSKQQALSDLQARLAASGGSKGAAEAAAAQTAQNELASAGQHLQQVQARLASQARGGNLTGAQQAAAANELSAAQARVAAAMDKSDKAQAKLLSSGGLSVTQAQELRKAQEAVATAQAKKSAADAEAAKTQADLSKANLTGDQVLDMVKGKIGGIAEAQSKTFGGDLRRWKAQVEDFAATYGQRFGKDLLVAGPAMAGVGSIIESGFFGKIGKGIKTITGLGGAAKKASEAVKASSAVEAAAGAAAELPWLPVVAAIAAVALIGYVVYRNWGTIEKALKATWKAISGAAVDAFHAVVDFFEHFPQRILAMLSNAPKLLEKSGEMLLTGLLAGAKIGVKLLEWYYIKLPLMILGWLGDAGTWLLDLGGKAIVGLWNGAVAMDTWLAGQLASLPGKFLNFLGDANQWLIETGKDLISGLWGGIESMGSWLLDKLTSFAKKALGPFAKVFGISSPSKVMHQYGVWVAQGLANGITAGAPGPRAAMANLALPPLPGAGGASTPTAVAPVGPQVVHQYQNVNIIKPTIQTSDLGKLTDQMQAEHRRANFSGSGVSTTGLPAGTLD